MRLYLDDDSASHLLGALLRKAGHEAVFPTTAGLSGASDARHFRFAAEHGLVILTRNHDDFEELHGLIMATGGSHPGLLLIRMDNDPKRDMKPHQIVAAIRKFEQVGASMVNEAIVLNHYR